MRRGALVAVALLLAACGGGDEEDADGTTTTAAAPTTTRAETTTTTAAPDPFSIPTDPADIDEAYVEAVLAELERINGDALRLAVSEGLSPRIAELVRSIYTPQRAGTELEVLARSFAEGFPGVVDAPGDAAPSVSSILMATPRCIGVDALIDFSAVSESVTEPLPVRIELRIPEPDEPRNETPWVYSVRTVNDGAEQLADPCVGA